MKISEVSVSRPIFATMMISALLVLGLFSYSELSIDMYPDIDMPIAVVQTVYPGASAETVETEVTIDIEDACNQVAGIRHITSTSTEGFSLIIIEFELERDGAVATQEIREKVSQVIPNLPGEIEEPIIGQYDPSAMPILSVAVSGDRRVSEMTRLADDVIKKRLESINGVGSIELIGGQEREIAIALNPERMEAYQVAVADVRASIMAANLEIPGGRVGEHSREYMVRMAGKLTSVHQFNEIVVKGGSQPVYLSDIARVIDTVEEKRSLAVYDGRQSVALSIIKQSKANTVDVSTRVKERLEQLRLEMPPDVSIDVVSDNAKFIEDSVHEIIFNIEFGTTLAVFVIFLFLLSFRPTIITGLAIPISLIATFTVMKSLGYTMNIMTLMGLSLSVGILIDDAIVVVENIYRHMDQGKSMMQAAIDGTKEIGLAVMATTFSIVAVFVPIAFMSGMVGRFFTEFGITVAAAVLISLFVAFTLTPMMSSRMLAQGEPLSHRKGLLGGLARFLNIFWKPIVRLLSIWNKMFDSLKLRYAKLLAGSLKRRWLVILVAVSAFALAIYLTQFIGSEFMTSADEGKFSISIQTPPGTDLDESYLRVQEVDRLVRTVDEVVSTYLTIGEGNDAVNVGNALVILTDKSERELTVFEIMDSVRIMLADVPGVKLSVNKSGGKSREKPVQISIRGPEMRELTDLTRLVEKIFYQMQGVTDIDNTMEEGKPELYTRIDRKLAGDLELSLYEIPMTVRTLIEGEVVTRYKEGEDEFDVRLRLDEPFRNETADIGRILVKSNKKVPGVETYLVPLSQVASFEKRTSIGQFNRYDRSREVRVNANVLTGSFAGTVTNLILEETAGIQLSPGYTIGAVGEAEMMEESFLNIFKALALAVIFIYLLLASQYESLSDPLSIMLSLPMSLIGAIIGLLGSSFSIMSLIGIVLLMGLVTKNAILLIDFVKQLRAEGVARYDAIMKAGPIRLRPILMTTLAMVFGMLPLALGIGPGAEFRSPMARAAIGGIISSTALTLIVVPVVYTLVEDFVGLFRRKKVEAGSV
ncbi:MAG: efflux RND transporter permease subunit [bacterium]|nr:efflux RND transporter permease subunit [bacterium]